MADTIVAKKRALALNKLAWFFQVWCPRLQQDAADDIDVMKANDKNDHDAADLVCEECKSIIANAARAEHAHRPDVRTKRAAKAREMASQEIDRLCDP